MIYFSPQAKVIQDADPALWGLILTPARWGRSIPGNFLWLADNGCFTGTWNEEEWLAWLDSLIAYQHRCVCVALPDVVGDAAATLELYDRYEPIIHARGWRCGLVAQDGLEDLPWPEHYDALFIGGSTDWKLSPHADACIRRAQAEGKWVHVGRVNSKKRIRHFQLIGVNSVDGTNLCYDPDEAYRTISKAIQRRPLFQLG